MMLIKSELDDFEVVAQRSYEKHIYNSCIVMIPDSRHVGLSIAVSADGITFYYILDMNHTIDNFLDMYKDIIPEMIMMYAL